MRLAEISDTSIVSVNDAVSESRLLRSCVKRSRSMDPPPDAAPSKRAYVARHRPADVLLAAGCTPAPDAAEVERCMKSVQKKIRQCVSDDVDGHLAAILGKAADVRTMEETDAIEKLVARKREMENMQRMLNSLKDVLRNMTTIEEEHADVNESGSNDDNLSIDQFLMRRIIHKLVIIDYEWVSYMKSHPNEVATLDTIRTVLERNVMRRGLLRMRNKAEGALSNGKRYRPEEEQKILEHFARHGTCPDGDGCLEIGSGRKEVGVVLHLAGMLNKPPYEGNRDKIAEAFPAASLETIDAIMRYHWENPKKRKQAVGKDVEGSSLRD